LALESVRDWVQRLDWWKLSPRALRLGDKRGFGGQENRFQYSSLDRGRFVSTMVIVMGLAQIKINTPNLIF